MGVDESMKRFLLWLGMMIMVACNGANVIWQGADVQYYDDSVTGPLYHVNWLAESGWWELGIDLTIQCALVGDSGSIPRRYDLTFDLGAGGTHQSWVEVNQGDVVSPETMHGLSDDKYLVHYDHSFYDRIGQTHLTVEPYEEIYLAFVGTDGDYSPPDIYGWIALSVDMAGIPSVRGAYDAQHGPMIVGGGSWTGGIPEPSGGVLMLIGLAAVGLRRRSHGTA